MTSPDVVGAAVGDPQRIAAVRQTGLLDSPPDESFDRITRLAARLLDVPVAFISFVDEDRQFFKSCFGFPEPYASTRQTGLERSFCKHVVARSEPLIIEDAARNPLVRENPAREEFGVGAYLGVPLLNSDGHVLGTLCAVAPEPREWSETDVSLLEDLRDAVMSEVELRARLLDRDRVEAVTELHRRVLQDPLTGIPNRTLFFDRARQALSRAGRSGELVAALFVDLDGFKEVNDQLGHLAGDSVLREAADRLSRQVRAHDTVARFGGDEFVVLLERLTSAREAEEVAERLVRSLRDLSTLADTGSEVTASVGVAFLPRTERDPESTPSVRDVEEVLRKADAAMYRAKREGGADWRVHAPPEG